MTKTVGTSFSVLDDCVVHNGCILCAAAVLWAVTVFAVLCCDMGSLIFWFLFQPWCFPRGRCNFVWAAFFVKAIRMNVIFSVHCQGLICAGGFFFSLFFYRNLYCVMRHISL